MPSVVSELTTSLCGTEFCRSKKTAPTWWWVDNIGASRVINFCDSKQQGLRFRVPSVAEKSFGLYGGYSLSWETRPSYLILPCTYIPVHFVHARSHTSEIMWALHVVCFRIGHVLAGCDDRSGLVTRLLDCSTVHWMDTEQRYYGNGNTSWVYHFL